MADFPLEFQKRMQKILGEEYEAFLRESDGVRQYGLRVNTAKIGTEEFERIAPFHLTRIPWIPNGYFYEKEDEPARHPFYAAGLYYLQEPSAMTPASRLVVNPGEKVLDLCAAPGGKATALAASLQGEGLIVANDINTARARALLRNMELFGITNSFITNEPPYILAEKFPEYFDKIMVDAPCSGEGMFRKNPAAMDAWCEKGPEYFSALQREIVLHGADMLRPGGQMLYSTCTFAPEENEGTITFLLQERPEMELIPMEDYEGFVPGLANFDGQVFDASCALCRRIWPHHMGGEGHFLALLRKKGDDGEELSSRKKSVRAGSAWWNQLKGTDREQREALGAFFCHVDWPLTAENVEVRGDKVYYVPQKSLVTSRIHFLRNGVYLGDLKKKRFEPSQPFALALRAEEYDRTINLSEEDERLARYLRGESILVDDVPTDGNGWYLLLVSGYPLGWGKLTGTTLKNKYPSGWRRNA